MWPRTTRPCILASGWCRPPRAARPLRRSPTPVPSTSPLRGRFLPPGPLFLYPPGCTVKRVLSSPPRPFSLPLPSSSLLERDRAPLHPPCLLSTPATGTVAISSRNRSRRHRFNPSWWAPTFDHRRPLPWAPPHYPSHPRATGPTKAHRRPLEPNAAVKHHRATAASHLAIAPSDRWAPLRLTLPGASQETPVARQQDLIIHRAPPGPLRAVDRIPSWAGPVGWDRGPHCGLALCAQVFQFFIFVYYSKNLNKFQKSIENTIKLRKIQNKFL
jgi:hypothetical protein